MREPAGSGSEPMDGALRGLSGVLPGSRGPSVLKRPLREETNHVQPHFDFDFDFD
jgi:hypothetical protein